MKNRSKGRQRRKLHIRKSISGTASRPRVSMFRSNKYLFVQLADDDKGTCMVGLSEMKLKPKADEKPVDRASRLGTEFAEILKKKKVKEIIFDRGGYKYHGRVKAFAEAMRKAGIKF